MAGSGRAPRRSGHAPACHAGRTARWRVAWQGTGIPRFPGGRAGVATRRIGYVQKIMYSIHLLCESGTPDTHMVDIAQPVEQLIVVQQVARSSRVIHPTAGGPRISVRGPPRFRTRRPRRACALIGQSAGLWGYRPDCVSDGGHSVVSGCLAGIHSNRCRCRSRVFGDSAVFRPGRCRPRRRTRRVPRRCDRLRARLPFPVRCRFSSGCRLLPGRLPSRRRFGGACGGTCAAEPTLGIAQRPLKRSRLVVYRPEPTLAAVAMDAPSSRRRAVPATSVRRSVRFLR